jgi:hypothetical protein
MMRLIIAAVALSFVSALAVPAAAAGLPTKVGQCVDTTVKSVEERLEDGATNKPVPGSGSAISFANGGYQVSYEQMPAVDASRAGDPIRLCLASIPQNCPPGDNRGREYKTTNLRTHHSWRLPDSEHSCGGA